MSKKYLRSDLTNDEAHFLTSGNGVFGEENAITGIFKLIGKYSELKEQGRIEELKEYNPKLDTHFKHENRGITEFSQHLKSTKETSKFSRRDLKYLSRKWCFTAVVLNSSSDRIIQELITYISDDDVLKSVCLKHLSDCGAGWGLVMPIQYEFLSTRFKDQHKDYRTAGKIMNELTNVSLTA